MYYKFNKFLEKSMPYFIPASVLIGVLLSDYIKDYAFLIPWIFAFMTFAGSLNSNFDSFKQVVLHPFPLFIVFSVLHIIMPLLALGIGHLAFSGDIYTITGLVLSMTLPLGITSFVWVAINKGNIALTLAIILIGTFISPFFLPFTMSLLVGGNLEMDVFSMMWGLIWMIVIPSIVGMMINQITKGKVVAILSVRLAPLSKVGMWVVVALNGAVVAPYLLDVKLKLIGIALVVICISFLGYFLSFLAGLLFKQDKEDVIAITFTGGMRNISAGVVLATSYFPAPVAVPVILGMLFQQILASVFGMLMGKYYKNLKVKEVVKMETFD
jgi:BASS family bile acid:Na+ symporter